MTPLSLLLASVITELRFPCSFPAVNAVTVHLLLASLGSVSPCWPGSAPSEVCKVCDHMDSLVSLRNIKTLWNAIANLVTNLPPSSEAWLRGRISWTQNCFLQYFTVRILRWLFLCYFLMGGYISVSSLKTTKQSAPCKMNGQLRMWSTCGSFVKHQGKTKLYGGRDETKNEVRKWKLLRAVTARTTNSKSCSGGTWQKWNITKHTKENTVPKPPKSQCQTNGSWKNKTGMHKFQLSLKLSGDIKHKLGAWFISF